VLNFELKKRVCYFYTLIFNQDCNNVIRRDIRSHAGAWEQD